MPQKAPVAWRYSPWHFGLLFSLLFHHLVAADLCISGVTLLGLPRLKVQLGVGKSGSVVPGREACERLSFSSQAFLFAAACGWEARLPACPSSSGGVPEHVCVCCFWGGGRCIQTSWWGWGSSEQAGREEEAWVHPRALLFHSTHDSGGGKIF